VISSSPPPPGATALPSPRAGAAHPKASSARVERGTATARGESPAPTASCAPGAMAEAEACGCAHSPRASAVSRLAPTLSAHPTPDRMRCASAGDGDGEPSLASTRGALAARCAGAETVGGKADSELIPASGSVPRRSSLPACHIRKSESEEREAASESKACRSSNSSRGACCQAGPPTDSEGGPRAAPERGGPPDRAISARSRAPPLNGDPPGIFFGDRDAGCGFGGTVPGCGARRSGDTSRSAAPLSFGEACARDTLRSGDAPSRSGRRCRDPRG